jgi:MYXO-CTERM domain-containing protein
MRISALLMTGAVAAVAVAGSAMASGAVINGGTSWTGWQTVGRSTDQGIWANGATTGVYDIYTTSFLYAGETVTPTAGTSGSADTSGWSTGARVLGVGMKNISGMPVYGGSGPWAFSPFFKFDLAKDSYQAASTFGGTDGRTSSSTFARTGDFNVQLNGDFGGFLYQPNFVSVYTSDGSFWTGGGAATFQGNAFGIPVTYARSWFNPDNGSLQVLFNLDLLSGNGALGGIGTIGNNFRMSIDGITTSTVFDVTVVPAPGALALLGAAGLVGSRRRR